MQQIAIKIIEKSGHNLYLAKDKNNIKYQIEDKRSFKIGNYYKIDLIIENRKLGMLGSKTITTIKDIQELQIINNRLCFIDGSIFKSS